MSEIFAYVILFAWVGWFDRRSFKRGYPLSDALLMLGVVIALIPIMAMTLLRIITPL